MSENEGKLGGKNVKAAERASVTYDGLVAEFGEVEGEAKYNAIASIPVSGGVLFFNPAVDKMEPKPELAVANLPPALRTTIADIIKNKQSGE